MPLHWDCNAYFKEKMLLYKTKYIFSSHCITTVRKGKFGCGHGGQPIIVSCCDCHSHVSPTLLFLALFGGIFTHKHTHCVFMGFLSRVIWIFFPALIVFVSVLYVQSRTIDWFVSICCWCREPSLSNHTSLTTTQLGDHQRPLIPQ